MKRKLFLSALGLILLFLTIMLIWGDKAMKFHPGGLIKSGWDEGLPIERYALKGIITGLDEGRGLKIWVDTATAMLRVKGMVPVDSNAGYSSSPYLTYGDSIIKTANNDTFKIIRNGKTYTWQVEVSSIHVNNLDNSTNAQQAVCCDGFSWASWLVE